MTYKEMYDDAYRKLQKNAHRMSDSEFAATISAKAKHNSVITGNGSNIREIPADRSEYKSHRIRNAVVGIALTAAVLTGAVFGLNWLNEHGGLHEGGIKTDNGAGAYDPVAVIDANNLSENTPDKITVSAEDTVNPENNETAIIDADVVLPDNTKYAVYNVSNRTRSEEEAKKSKICF